MATHSTKSAGSARKQGRSTSRGHTGNGPNQQQQQQLDHKQLGRILQHAHAAVRRQLKVGKQEEEEEEEVQEILVRLLACTVRGGRSLAELAEDELRKMLKVLVRCRAADLWRSGRRRKFQDLPHQLPDRGPTPEAAASNAELASLLRRAIDSLPERMRAVILARFLENRTYAEIADELGVSKNYCYQLCHRALLRLRRTLDKFF